MNRGYFYLAASIAAVLVLFVQPPLWLVPVALWLALSCGYFALGYLLWSGEALRKGADGRIPRWIKALLAPVLGAIALYQWWRRRCASGPAFHSVANGLWVGRWMTREELPELRAAKIGSILDVTAELESPVAGWAEEDFSYANIPIFDHHTPTMPQLHKALCWIRQEHSRGREVLVHCALGQGRSVLVVLAYRLAENPEARPEALLRELQETRQRARPNRWQMRLLHRLAAERKQLEDSSGAVLIFNPTSGPGDPERARQELEQRLAPYLNLQWRETTPERSAAALAEQALQAGARRILAAGGDGTVAEVASALAGSQAALGILPLGTANAFAAALFGEGMRSNAIAIATQHVLSGQSRTVDTATVNGRSMILLAGVGIEQRMILDVDEEFKERWGFLAYMAAALRGVREQEDFRVKLEIDGRQFNFEAASLVVANAAPASSVLARGGGAPSFDDGYLDITAIRKGTTEELLRRLLDADDKKAPLGEGEAQAPVLHFRARQGSVTTEPVQRLVVDGEEAGETPLRFAIRPRSLRVLCDSDPAA